MQVHTRFGLATPLVHSIQNWTLVVAVGGWVFPGASRMSRNTPAHRPGLHTANNYFLNIYFMKNITVWFERNWDIFFWDITTWRMSMQQVFQNSKVRLSKTLNPNRYLTIFKGSTLFSTAGSLFSALSCQVILKARKKAQLKYQKTFFLFCFFILSKTCSFEVTWM